MPRVPSSRSWARPVSRIRSSSRRNRAGSVIVVLVRAGIGALTTRSTALSSLKASIAFPSPVQYAGSRAPTADGAGTLCRPVSFSM